VCLCACACACGSEAKCHVFVEWLHISTYVWMQCGTTDPAQCRVWVSFFFTFACDYHWLKFWSGVCCLIVFDESADVETCCRQWFKSQSEGTFFFASNLIFCTFDVQKELNGFFTCVSCSIYRWSCSITNHFYYYYELLINAHSLNLRKKKTKT